jgi:hypothetical protein
MMLYGVASDNSKDAQGQTLEPSGYQIDRFISDGFIDYEHLGNERASYHIGEPVEGYVKDNKFFIKAKLWNKSKRARDVWDTIHVMKSSGSKRKVGWSIQGKAVAKDPYDENHITKAIVTKCTLTFSPINYNTWADIVKGVQKDDFVNYEFDEDEANGGRIYLLDVTNPDGVRVTIDKDFNIKVYKSMSAGNKTGRQLDGVPTSGAALKKESLDDRLINLQPEVKDAILAVAKRHKRKPLDDDIIKRIKNNVNKVLI